MSVLRTLKATNPLTPFGLTGSNPKSLHFPFLLFANIYSNGGERGMSVLWTLKATNTSTGFALRGFESHCFTLFSYIAYIAF